MRLVQTSHGQSRFETASHSRGLGRVAGKPFIPKIFARNSFGLASWPRRAHNTVMPTDVCSAQWFYADHSQSFRCPSRSNRSPQRAWQRGAALVPTRCLSLRNPAWQGADRGTGSAGGSDMDLCRPFHLASFWSTCCPRRSSSRIHARRLHLPPPARRSSGPGSRLAGFNGCHNSSGVSHGRGVHGRGRGRRPATCTRTGASVSFAAASPDCRARDAPAGSQHCRAASSSCSSPPNESSFVVSRGHSSECFHSRLGKTPNTGGESPSQSFFSRNSPEDRAFAGRPVGARLCGPQPRGRRSRGGESGTAPGSQDFRSNASADVSADAAKFCTLEEAHSCQNSGPCVRSFERGRRRGQRARQQLRRQRVHGQGRICPGRTGSGESIRSDSCQFAEGTGHSVVTGDGISASEVCGKEDSSGRAPPPEPICLYDFRSLDDRFQQPERRVARDPQQDAFLRRTVCHRPRALSSSLAIDGVARTPVPNSGVREKANQPAAVLQTVPPGLDRSQPCFPQRSGLFREPRSSCAQTCEEQQTRRRRQSAEDQKAKTPERKRQRQRSGSATEFERHHRSVMQPVHRWHAQLSTMDGLDNFSPRDQVDNAKSRAQGQVDNPKSRAQGLPHTGSGCVLPDLTSSSAEQFCSFDLILHACRGFRNAPTGLGHFIRESLVPVDACTVEEASKPLWPVPLPRWRWTAQRLSPRRRRRQRFLKARHELLQVVIASLNWEVLGFPLTPPKTARLGSEFSSAQHQTVERLESMLDHFLRMPDFKAEDLGRAHDKFSSVINMVKELPKCQLGLEDLTELASQLKHDLDPYSSHFKSRPKPVVRPEPSEHACSLGPVKPPRGLNSKPVQSSQVKWNSPPTFDAAPFLDDLLVRAAFLDPEVLRKSPEHWPAAQPARVHCSKAELLSLATRWDELGACMLLPVAEKDFSEAVGLFCVPKDKDFDRLIVNPVTINSRMHTVARATKELAPGCLLSLLHLEPHSMFGFSADDLSDYYYTFRVSDSRATRNAIRIKIPWYEVQHFSCFKPEFVGKDLLVCLRTLAMGDSLAVEIGQSAHSNVIRQFCGGLLAAETLRYRYPVPRSDFIELLAIDDHVGIQKLPICDCDKNLFLRDSQIFKDAGWAYKHVGLVQQEKKQKRNQTEGIILGADFDGRLGRVMAPRSRILILMMITLQVATQGTCTPKLLDIILGCWVHILMFRRVLFAIMDSLFKEGLNVPPNQVFCLSRQSRCELQLLATLSPLAQSDLRAKYASHIYCTDASGTGGAVCAAPVTPAVSQELWRHSEQKGFYTRLQNPASAVLSELGYDSEVAQQFVSEPLQADDAKCFSVPAALSEGFLYDCCEIFRGVGNWSAVHSSRGLSVHDGIDVDGRRLRVGDLSMLALSVKLQPWPLAGWLEIGMRECHASVSEH